MSGTSVSIHYLLHHSDLFHFHSTSFIKVIPNILSETLASILSETLEKKGKFNSVIHQPFSGNVVTGAKERIRGLRAISGLVHLSK